MPTISPEQMQSDAAVLNSLLDLERMAVIAYGEASRKLTGVGRRAAGVLLAHEQAHEHALEQAVLGLGATPARPRPTRDYTATFPPLATATDMLRFALDLENTQVSAYGDSLGSLVTPGLRVAIASILATEAEHMSVVLGLLHEPQASQALVTGDTPT